MQKKIKALSILAILVASLSGCVSPEPAQEGKLYVRTLIDGNDILYIKGDTMWFEHNSYQRPGKWAGSDLPTYINQDQQWMHVWNSNLSDVVKIVKPESALPTSGTWNSENMMVKFFTAGFGNYLVKEYPSKENNFTLVIELNDTEPLGAHWYCIDIDWDETAK